MHKAISLALVALAALTLVFDSVASVDLLRACQPRPLTAAEREAAEKLAARLRHALPAPPPQWKVRDERANWTASACRGKTAGSIVEQPVQLTVYRIYAHAGAAAAEPTAPVTATSPLAATDDADDEQARAEDLEQQIGELQQQEKEATSAWRAARRRGDRAGEKAAAQQRGEVRLALQPLQRELAELRRAEREQRAAAAAADARTAAEYALLRPDRRVASVSIYANLALFAGGGATHVALAGVPQALRDTFGRIYLLFGRWRTDPRTGATLGDFDEALPTTRVQNLGVRIDGDDVTSEELLKALDLAVLQAAVE